MSLRIFDEPHATESVEQPDVSIVSRIVFGFWAVLVALPPSVAAAFAALQVTNLFRNLKNAETSGQEAIFSTFHDANLGLIAALVISALLAFGMALALTLDPKRRLAGVGLPLSIGVPILALTPGLFLWTAESRVIDLLTGKFNNVSVPNFAETIASLLFLALVLGLIFQAVIIGSTIVSIFIPLRRRSDPLSAPRAFIWLISGVLLLMFAGLLFVLV